MRVVLPGIPKLFVLLSCALICRENAKKWREKMQHFRRDGDLKLDELDYKIIQNTAVFYYFLFSFLQLCDRPRSCLKRLLK